MAATLAVACMSFALPSVVFGDDWVIGDTDASAAVGIIYDNDLTKLYVEAEDSDTGQWLIDTPPSYSDEYFTAAGFARASVDHIGTVTSARGIVNAFSVAPLNPYATSSAEDVLCYQVGASVGTGSPAVYMTVIGGTAGPDSYWQVGSTIVSGLHGGGNQRISLRNVVTDFHLAGGAEAIFGFDTAHTSSSVTLHYRAQLTLASPTAGDVTRDGVIDQFDLTLVGGTIGLPSPDLTYDLNADSAVDADDVDVLLSSLGTVRGDVNLDAMVDFTDLLAFGHSYGSIGTWFEGDFDGDGSVGFTDQLVLSQNYGYGVPPSANLLDFASASALVGLVPEPTSLAALAGTSMIALRRRRSR